MRRILNRRRGDKETDNDNAAWDVEEEGFVELLDGTLPNNLVENKNCTCVVIKNIVAVYHHPVEQSIRDCNAF